MRVVKGRKKFEYFRDALLTYAAAHRGAFIAKVWLLHWKLELVGTQIVPYLQVKIKIPLSSFCSFCMHIYKCLCEMLPRDVNITFFT